MSEVKVEIKAETGLLATGLAKAQKNIQNFGKDVTSNITDKLAGAFSGAGVAAGIGSLATMTMAAGKAIMDFAGNLQDASEAMGLTVEQLQGLHGAFMLGGASAEDVDKGISKLLQNMDTATNSVGPIRDAFDKLGVSFETLSNGDPDAVIRAISDGVKNATNPTEAYAAVLDLLGKSGKKMMAGLRDGGDALEEISKKTSKLSNEDAAAIGKFGDTVDVLRNKMAVLTARSATPIFADLNTALDDTEPKMTRFMKAANLLQKFTTLGGFVGSQIVAKPPEPPKPEDFYGPTMAELLAPVVVDPKIKAAAEEQAKMDAENQKKADAYAEKKLAEANKIADVEMSNAQEIEKQRRDQLDTEGQINALLEDRKNLQSEIASSSGKQRAEAQKDLIAVEKDLATAKAKGIDERIAEGEAMEKEIQAKEKQAEEATKKKEDVRDAQIGQAEKEADLRTATKAKQDSIIEQMADEEMKTPMQRANEDRVAREKERIQNSLRRRIDAGKLSGKSSKAMEKLQMEFDASEKTLEKEVEKLTLELKQVVKKINKG